MPKSSSPIHARPLPNTTHPDALQHRYTSCAISFLHAAHPKYLQTITSPQTHNPTSSTMDNTTLLIAFVVLMLGLTTLFAVAALCKHCYKSRKNKKTELKSYVQRDETDRVFWFDVLENYNIKQQQAAQGGQQ
ncbi:hypothetical protein IWX90DRAFT_482456 [Phyllosticta citrichinensis]|uniref:Uncharacterized protein n=1 Tax=Phyllosticta citrichinensis TaxID=1130410 RepID=A0ABR1Y6N6_9PEZI